MSPHELNALHIVHLSSVLVLLCYTFYAFAAAPETRKGVLAITGIAALVAIGTGLRMWQGLYSFAPLGWILCGLCGTNSAGNDSGSDQPNVFGVASSAVVCVPYLSSLSRYPCRDRCLHNIRR